MAQKTLRIGLISDPHAYNGPSGDASPSFLVMEDDQNNVRQNPFAGLMELVGDKHLQCDYLFCGGDLGDKASPQAQQYAWNCTHELSVRMGAKEVFAAAGNHDVDSRFQNSGYDAKGHLLALEPKFPTARNVNWLEYWAKNYSVVDLIDFRIVLLNSSAFHGYAKEQQSPEYLHGRVSDRTLDMLNQDLDRAEKRPVNILFCHHHPTKNDRVRNQDYSHMENGDLLINALQELDVGPWLVIHGHKHAPKLQYASGDSSAPTVFSAGSMSAKPFDTQQSTTACEFYIINIILDTDRILGSVRGRIDVWQWGYGVGWSEGRRGIGLGSTAGFGARADVDELAHDIAAKLKSESSGRSVAWQKVLEAFKKVEYLVPTDYERLINRLRHEHGLKCLGEGDKIDLVEVPEC